MRLTVLGSGDAFGSGGRLQTAFHVAPAGGTPFLIDCGVTAVMGLERAGLDANAVAAIFITHLHGDHFGGLPWWLIHAQHVSARRAPLTIAGPPGLEARFRMVTDALYPSATRWRNAFELRFVDLVAGAPVTVEGVEVAAFEVSHPSGAPSYALRCAAGEGAERRTVAFSGDTEWVESLIPAAAHADLFISECYGFAEPARYHLTWREIERELPRLSARRILLTHMGRAMLANREAVRDPRVTLAEDGMVIDL